MQPYAKVHKHAISLWTPIFTCAGNLFVVISTAFVAESEPAAEALGARARVSLAQHHIEFTGAALHLAAQQRYLPARLAGLPVAILSGPAFTHAIAFATA